MAQQQNVTIDESTFQPLSQPSQAAAVSQPQSQPQQAQSQASGGTPVPPVTIDHSTFQPLTSSPSSTDPATPSKLDQYEQGSGVMPGLVRAVHNFARMPGQVWDALTAPPQDEDEQAIYENGITTPNQGTIPGVVALPIHRLIVSPSVAAQSRAQHYNELAAAETNPKIKKQLLDAAEVYKGTSYLPMVGPLAAALAERGAYGPQGASVAGKEGGDHLLGNSNSDLAGASAEGVAYVAAPWAVGKVLPLAGKMVRKMAPETVDVGGTPVPVRSAVANPSLPAKVVEGMASAPKLQEFDVTETQPAARRAIAKIATEDVRNPALQTVATAQKAGALGDILQSIQDIKDAQKAMGMEKPEVIRENGKFSFKIPVPADEELVDGKLPQAFADNVTKLAQAAKKIASMHPEDIDTAFNKWVSAENGDFGQVAKQLKQALSPHFERASEVAQQEFGKSWQELANDRDAAFRRGDVTEYASAKAKMKSAFDKANYQGTHEAMSRLYSKLEDIDRVNDVFKSKQVVKRTPVQFLDDVIGKEQTQGRAGVDPGIIDGAALRDAVRSLDNEPSAANSGRSVFENVGLSPDRILQLQKLGSLLERSKVQPGFKPSGTFSRLIKSGWRGTAGQGIAYLMTHPEAADNAVSSLQKSLGLPAVGAVTSAHTFNPDTKKVEDSKATPVE